MASSKHENKTRKGTCRSGQIKKAPIFDDDAPVSTNKSSCLSHGGTCVPCTQQQMVQRSRSGDYTFEMSVISFYQSCNAMLCSGKLKSYEIKHCLQQQFPLKKNVNKHHVWNMRRKVNSMLPSVSNIKSFREFEESCNTSNLELGLDNTPLSDDDVAEVAKEVWEDLTANASHDNAIVTFQEHMELLKQSNRGFGHAVLRDSLGKCTGCV